MTPPANRVLVVDDEPSIRRTLGVLFTRNGYEVRTAGDGRDAMAILKEENFGLMVTDVAMPEVGGIELMRTVRRLGLPMAVVVMTAYGAEDVAIQAIRLGAADYFRKPLDLRQVLIRADEILKAGRHRARMEGLVRRLKAECGALNERLSHYEESLSGIADRYASHAKQVLLGEAAATLTHEINNPLHVIQGRLELLRDAREDDPEVLEHVNPVLNQISRIARMAGRVREIGRGGRKVRRAVDVGEGLREVVELMTYSYAVEGVTVECEVEPDLPAVEADFDELQQVWFNLIKNAFEAIQQCEARDPDFPPSPADFTSDFRKTSSDRKLRRTGGLPDIASSRTKGRILVKARASRGGLRILIGDNGPGIPADRLGGLRDPRPFQTTKAKGLGLGLCEAHRIVSEHGGRWEIMSKVGKGTVFRISLPAEGAREGSARILVVEDEEALGRQIVRFLSGRGYRTDLAVGGAEGLERGLARRYALVVFDVLMPNIDGPVMFRRLRETWSELRGIAVTADPDFTSDDVAVLRKPLELDALGAAVARELPRNTAAQAV